MKNGDTALHTAVRNDQSECVKLLARAGINPNIANYKKETALDIAKSKSCDKCIDLVGWLYYFFNIMHLWLFILVFESKYRIN